MLRIALASLHLLALGLGFGAVLQRGSALRDPRRPGALPTAMRADMLWGIAAALWLSTGLWRLLAGLEKPTGYYVTNHFFLVKMGLFVLIVALEIGPMVTLIRWRKALASGGTVEQVADTRAARRITTISHLQAGLIVLMVIAATAMARGYGTHE